MKEEVPQAQVEAVFRLFNVSLAVLFSRPSPATQWRLCGWDDADENSGEPEAINSSL